MEVLRSNVRGKVFVVTPDEIAALLGNYKRPPPTPPVYPHNVPRPKKMPELVELMYEDPSTFKGTVQSGRLKPTYGLLNKLLHCNLSPRGAEKKPNLEKLNLVDAVVSGKTIDFALLIWQEMKEFAETQKPIIKLPFGSLITRMCMPKVKGYALTRLRPQNLESLAGRAKRKERQ